MCGINGFIQFESMFNKDKLYNIVHLMNDQILHRGPNSEGLYADSFCALGMRRLSIIDLENGSQPIWNETHDTMIVFNGELYNYQVLRSNLILKGHIFKTNSDTEVVLHGFESYGKEFLKKMEGMFAFAIYNTHKKEWIIARDRIGEKPLYYYRDDKSFIFSSELKSMLYTDIVPKTIDKEALSQYFQLTYIPAPKSIIKDVYKLMPATALTINSNGCVSEYKYWELENLNEDELIYDYSKCKKLLREALFNSVEQRMISDVPIGAFLSGGFDSSIIVGIMAKLSSKPINTFTIGFNDKVYDESKIASIVAKKNRTNHQVLILDWENVHNDIDYILENIDEPFADSSLIATYSVSKMARQYVTVTLTGDAGDELFAGYNKYLVDYYSDRYIKLPKMIRKGIFEHSIKMLSSKSELRRKAEKVINSSQLEPFERRKLLMSLGFKPNELENLMNDSFVDRMDFISQQYDYLRNYDDQAKAQYVDLKTVLEGDMLTKVDRASMLASLETRVPMLDSNVIEIAFKMPTQFKINKKDRKIILKDTFEDLLPKELFNSPKHGFGVPIDEWLETILKSNLLRYASKDFIDEQGLFNYDYINSFINNHLSHKENRYSELWSFYVFQNWYERVIIKI